MIDPHHSCWWTGRQITQLALRDAGWALSGSSLRVILAGLFDPDLRWYSVTQGDAVWIAACPAMLEADPSQESDSADHPIAAAVGDLFPVAEYPLTPPLAEQMGLTRLIWGDPGPGAVPFATRLKEAAGVRYLITTHDDCWGYVYPQDRETGHRLITAILQLHGFYLGQEFNGDVVVPRLLEVLQHYQAIRVRAHRSRQRRQIAVEVPQQLWSRNIWPGLEFQPRHWIEVRNAQSTWQ